MKLAAPALPDQWRASPLDPDGCRVTVPSQGTGCFVAGCATLLSPFILAAFGTWALGFIGVLVLLGLTACVFTLAHWLLVKQYWLVSQNRFLIHVQLLRLPLRRVVYRDCGFAVQENANGSWELQLLVPDGVRRTLHRSRRLPELLSLLAFLEQETGWTEAGEAAPAYLRVLMRQAIVEDNTRRLQEILTHPHAFSVLADVWQEAGPAYRSRIQTALVSLEAESALLSQRIADSEGQVPPFLIDSLAKSHDPRVLELLRKLVASPSGEISTRAVRALGRLRDLEVLPQLCDALRFEPALWPAAITALGDMGHPDAVPALAELLGALKRESQTGLRNEIILALQKIGHPGAVPALAAALADASPTVRERAAEALGRIGSLEGVAALVQALQDGEKQVAANSAAALGAVRDPRSAEPLARSLAHGYLELRTASARALGEIGGDVAVAALCRGLEDPEERVYREAVLGLTSIALVSEVAPVQLRAALPALKNMAGAFSTESAEVKRACREAIRAIEARTASTKQLPLPAEPDLPPAETLPRPVGPTG